MEMKTWKSPFEHLSRHVRWKWTRQFGRLAGLTLADTEERFQIKWEQYNQSHEKSCGEVLENGDEDMKIFLWASLKTREVKMNSAVWAFGRPHACKHKGTFSNQVGTIQSEPFKFIIFNTVHTLWKGGKKNALYIIKESGTLLHPDAGNSFLFATQIPKISRNIHSYWAANWWS